MDKETFQSFWRDKKSWKFWGIYFRKDDPRIVVPTRLKWTGWTVNFAHPLKALITIGVSTLIALGPTLLVIFFGPVSIPLLITTMVLSVVLLIYISFRMANP